MTPSTQRNLILLTPLFIFLSHFMSMIPHEYAHSITAWWLGYKKSPWDVSYATSNWTNLLFQNNLDENVNYPQIIATGHGWHAALIAFAGPFLKLCLFVCALWLLLKDKTKVKSGPYFYYFLLFFNLMNLGDLYDYAPIRTFDAHGDAGHFAHGLHISPWWTYIIGGYIVAYLIWNFFTHTMLTAFERLPIKPFILRVSFMLVCVLILFGYYGSKGFIHGNAISDFTATTSLLIIPGVLLAVWPARRWMKRVPT
jgi:hypothetical protein